MYQYIDIILHIYSGFANKLMNVSYIYGATVYAIVNDRFPFLGRTAGLMNGEHLSAPIENRVIANLPLELALTQDMGHDGGPVSSR